MPTDPPATAAPRSYVAEWLMGNESLVAVRTHLLLDAVEEAVTRHVDVHPHRVADCEMCQFRGRVATAVLLNEPWGETPAASAASQGTEHNGGTRMTPPRSAGNGWSQPPA